MKYQVQTEYGGHVRGDFYAIVEADSPEEAMQKVRDGYAEHEEYCELRNDTEIQWDYATAEELL